jgi:hypothetical protein
MAQGGIYRKIGPSFPDRRHAGMTANGITEAPSRFQISASALINRSMHLMMRRPMRFNLRGSNLLSRGV